MGPSEIFGGMYDQMRAATGEFVVMGSRFDLENIVLRENVPVAFGAMSNIEIDPLTVERWAEQRWFAWQPVPGALPSGPDGPIPLGVPVYVVERLILFHELAAQGWTDVELADYAEYEGEFVESILLVERTPVPAAEDQGRATAIAWLREQECLYDDELMARRPREEWPDGWHWKSRGSELMEMPQAELEQQLDRARRYRQLLETRGWGAFTPAGAERLRRQVFIQAQWDECVNTLMLEAERTPLRAGVSWFLGLVQPFERRVEASSPFADHDPAT